MVWHQRCEHSQLSCASGGSASCQLHALPPAVPPSVQGEWVSMGVLSDGTHYDIPAGIVYSFPVRIHPDHSWEVVTGLEVNDFAREKMELSAKELLEERDTAISFLSGGEQ